MEHFFELLITVMIAVLGSNGLWAYIQSASKTKTAKDRMLLGLGHAEIFRTAEKYIERNGTKLVGDVLITCACTAQATA